MHLANTPHVNWLNHAGHFQTTGGARVDVWEFAHLPDEAVLTAWATHFRNHYCLDGDLPSLVAGTGKTRAEFLTDVKFPSRNVAPGPSTRSGDFSEILVADFIEYTMGYWCPRLRYLDRWNPNDSTKGADIVAFLFLDDDGPDSDDELFVVDDVTPISHPALTRVLG